MFARTRFGLMAAIATALCGASAAWAHLVIEPIGPIVLQPVPGPGNEFEAFFPNEFDTIHNKELKFEGVLQNLGPAGTRVDLFFDWLNPFTGQVEFGPLAHITINGGETQTYGGPTAITYTIPYCPPQVSIHIANVSTGGPVFVQGTFSHECLNETVPEPAMLLIAPALALMAPFGLRAVKKLGLGT